MPLNPVARIRDVPPRQVFSRASPWVFVAAALALRSPSLHGQPRAPASVQLSVTRDAGSDSCPDRERVRALVTARLRRDPITDDAPRRAALSFVHTHGHFEARLRLTHPGHPDTTRRLRTPASDCAPLGDAVGLVLALAIDPLLAMQPPPPPPPPPRVPEGATTQWRIGALATLTYGLAPGLFADAFRPGISVHFELLRGRWMLPLEAAVELPGRLQDASRNAEVSALPARVAAGACGRLGRSVVVTPCGIVTVGAMFASGRGYASDRSDVAWLAAAGARVGVEVARSSRWQFVGSLDALALVVRPALSLGSSAAEPIWTAAPRALSLAAGVSLAD